METKGFDIVKDMPSTVEECWIVIKALVAKIDSLTSKIESLEEQLKLSSKNSSLPPSKDLKKKVHKKKPTGRLKGAQKKHKGHNRKFFASTQADKIIKCLPNSICNCGGCVEDIKLSSRKQLLEIPQPKFLLHEYQVYSGTCKQCSGIVKGELPSGIGNIWFGVRAHSLMSLLRSKYRLSIRQVKQLLKDLYDMPISTGSISHAENRVSEALKEAHEEVKLYIQSSELPINVDETGYKQSNKNGWAWLLVNKMSTYFHLDHSRGKKVAKTLLGRVISEGKATIISDRYAAYNFIPETMHQVCWSHLKRDFQRISERAGVPGKIGRKLLIYYRLLFVYWKTSGKKRWWFVGKMRRKRKYWINRLLKELRHGASCGHKPTERTCANILRQGKSLWNFLYSKEVEPTNNLAERQLRPLVISRKLSFGADSARGARFIERIFTAIMTCAQQNRSILEFLNASVNKYFVGEKMPIKLIAATST